jgi:hypothetical protein
MAPMQMKAHLPHLAMTRACMALVFGDTNRAALYFAFTLPLSISWQDGVLLSEYSVTSLAHGIG